MIINKMRSIIVGVAGAALLLGMSTPVVAQDMLASLITGQGPFDHSNERCETIETLQCAMLQSHVTKIYTVGEIVEANTLRPFSDILKLNNWKDGEVTSDTVVPNGKKFAVRGSL